MVIDTSAMLAVFFAEGHGAWVAERLSEKAGELRMSTVNFAECAIRIRDRQPHLAEMMLEKLVESGIRFVPPDLAQARIAADARMTWPLNLGDCFAYALAKAESCAILTLDGDFRRTDCALVMP